jgi:hypothetical protein
MIAFFYFEADQPRGKFYGLALGLKLPRMASMAELIARLF